MRKLFDFVCETCGAIFEELAEDSAKTAICPECSGVAARRPGAAGQIRFRTGKTLVKGEEISNVKVSPGLKLTGK